MGRTKTKQAKNARTVGELQIWERLKNPDSTLDI